jgi:hypothetical protein
MGVYNNNKDGTRSTIANTIQVIDAPMEQFVSRGEFNAVVPSDTSADNKLVNDDTVNDIWKVQGEVGVKNLIPYPYTQLASRIAGVSIVSNEDGSITLNGTADKDIYGLLAIKDFGNSVFSSIYKPNIPYVAILLNGTNNIYLSYNKDSKKVELVVLQGTEINNVTVYPMICYKAYANDVTYVPYAKTNRELTDENSAHKAENDSKIQDIWYTQGKYGVKNLIPFPYKDKNGKNTGGITFTINNDGSITSNGTATGWAAFYFVQSSIGGFSLDKGKYILSYDASSDTTFSIQFIIVDGNGTSLLIHGVYGKRGYVEFEITDEIVQLFKTSSVQILIYANKGAVVNNVTIYPMIRLASDTDDTWQPYAPTNYQLNQKLDTIAGVYLPNATNINSKKVLASVGQTSVTFDANSFMTRYNVTSDDLDLDISAETASGDVVSYNNVSVTGGIVTVTFDALAEQTTFICKCSVIQ